MAFSAKQHMAVWATFCLLGRMPILLHLQPSQTACERLRLPPFLRTEPFVPVASGEGRGLLGNCLTALKLINDQPSYLASSFRAALTSLLPPPLIPGPGYTKRRRPGGGWKSLLSELLQPLCPFVFIQRILDPLSIHLSCA